MADKLKISLCFNGHETIEPPKIKIYHNSIMLVDASIIGQNQWIDFEIEPVSVNRLTIDFYNKRPDHTLTDAQGNIIKDLWLEITQARVDDILVQSWFLNDGWYEPRYFEDFAKNNPNLPTTLPSQRIWHFPGIYYSGQFPDAFWVWYHHQRNNRISLDNMDKDLHRWEKFVGSTEKYTDIVVQIKELINNA